MILYGGGHTRNNACFWTSTQNSDDVLTFQLLMERNTHLGILLFPVQTLPTSQNRPEGSQAHFMLQTSLNFIVKKRWRISKLGDSITSTANTRWKGCQQCPLPRTVWEMSLRRFDIAGQNPFIIRANDTWRLISRVQASSAGRALEASNMWMTSQVTIQPYHYMFLWKLETLCASIRFLKPERARVSREQGSRAFIAGFTEHKCFQYIYKNMSPNDNNLKKWKVDIENNWRCIDNFLSAKSALPPENVRKPSSACAWNGSSSKIS